MNHAIFPLAHNSAQLVNRHDPKTGNSRKTLQYSVCPDLGAQASLRSKEFQAICPLLVHGHAFCQNREYFFELNSFRETVVFFLRSRHPWFLPNPRGAWKYFLQEDSGTAYPLATRSQMPELKRLDGYAGQTLEQILALEGEYRVDSLVLVFEQALDQKAARAGVQSLTKEERVLLAVEALEREVNNGGYGQFSPTPQENLCRSLWNHCDGLAVLGAPKQRRRP